MSKLPRGGELVSLHLLRRNACEESEFPAELVLVPRRTTPVRPVDKPDRLLGVGGMIVVATVIALSIYSVVKYLW